MSIRTTITTTAATDSLRNDSSLAATLDLEQQIARVEQAMVPLRKAQKKLEKVEDEIVDTNFLIDSGIGSRKDKVALRQTKKELRQRRVRLWAQLEALPALRAERQDLLHQSDVLRRRHGIL